MKTAPPHPSFRPFWLLGLFLALAPGCGPKSNVVPPAEGGPSLQGGIVAGGADSYIISDAFFRSSDRTRRIHACYEVSPNFGVPPADLAKTVHWAFAEWTRYLRETSLHYNDRPENAGINGELSALQAGCQGNEDLRVYFGVDRPEVIRLRPALTRPYAFSAMTDTESDRLWHRGFLWVAGPASIEPARGIPTWNQGQYEALRYLVLHEVGHVFGNSHVSGTVMDPLTGYRMHEWTAPKAIFGPFPLSIDEDKTLLPNINLAAEFHLATAYGCIPKSSGGTACGDPYALNRAYTRIYGLAEGSAPGGLTATARRLEPPGHTAEVRPDHVLPGSGALDVYFHAADGREIPPAHFTPSMSVANRYDSEPLFNGLFNEHYESFGISFSGHLQAAVAGAPEIPVVVSYNMRGALTIVDTEAGSGLEHTLLESSH